MGYFAPFQKLFYANTLATNIFARVKLDDSIINDASIYYPYEVKEGERPDHIANNYYNDPTLDWLVYFSNRLLDPYFEWPMAQQEFHKFIDDKYGSIQNAERKIVFYRVNWYGDDSVLSPASYQALAAGQKKYWKPVFGLNNTVLSYERKEMDNVVDTNRVVSIECTQSGPFVIDERVQQRSASGTLLAEATMQYANTTHLVVSRVQGAFVSNTSWNSIVGTTSNSTADVSTVSTIQISIPTTEEVYWSPVSAYTHEEEINAANKAIYLIDQRYVDTIEKQIRELLA